MPEAMRIFVSHHHSAEEDTLTAQLVSDLRAVGADVWVDTSGITSDDLVRRINEGLDGRQWLVLVMTPAAVASKWVQAEGNAALNETRNGRMRGVLPFVVQPCEETAMPILWRPLFRYDAVTNGYDAARDGLFRAMGLPPLPTQAQHPSGSLPNENQRRQLIAFGYEVRRTPVEHYAPPLCVVPAGPFLMGSDPEQDPLAGRSDEVPQTTVTLEAFSIATYPVTVVEYAAFITAASHPSPPELRDPVKGQVSWSAQQERPFHPVVMVTWYDALAYAQWLAGLTGQQWRLPTEAEWEKAARWDERAQRVYLYPWGDEYDPRKVCVQTGTRTSTTPVGAFLGGKSPCGALDMAGNVQEWTSSLYRDYPYVTGDRREDLSASGQRTMRGGSWRSYWQWVRAANRQHRLPRSNGDGTGFRLVVGR